MDFSLLENFQGWLSFIYGELVMLRDSTILYSERVSCHAEPIPASEQM